MSKSKKGEKFNAAEQDLRPFAELPERRRCFEAAMGGMTNGCDIPSQPYVVEGVWSLVVVGWRRSSTTHREGFSSQTLQTQAAALTLQRQRWWPVPVNIQGMSATAADPAQQR